MKIECPPDKVHKIWGMNSSDKLMKKNTGLNTVPFGMRHLLPQILAMHLLTNPGEMRLGLIEVVTGPGARKDSNPSSNINFIH
ncbi:MAG: hypothetical protein ABR999_01235 [Methanoregula sp.]|jgi:hypothetical protein|uniref:hypothetical protein n=1 Tax=Methanoregula sp. TaxID=2052170 RepID=UPI003D1455BB